MHQSIEGKVMINKELSIYNLYPSLELYLRVTFSVNVEVYFFPYYLLEYH